MPVILNPQGTPVTTPQAVTEPLAVQTSVGTAVPPLATAPTMQRGALGSAPALVTNGFMAGTAGPEIPGIAIGVNVLIEYAKNRSFFREQLWTIPLLVVLSFGIAVGVWYVVNENHNLQTAITNGFSILGTAHLNYTSSKAAGIPILAPTKEENKWHGGGV